MTTISRTPDLAAPVAPDAVLPPSAAPIGEPSAGSGGTALDPVQAKHAHYAAIIAAGKQAEADDAALAAKEAELAELTK
jgi:hypothetical protein